MFLFRGPGTQVSKPPPLLKKWAYENPEDAATVKFILLHKGVDKRLLSPFWGDACYTLLKEFGSILFAIYSRKREVQCGAYDDETTEKMYLECLRDVDAQYEKVKAAFDKAIARLEDEGLSPEEIQAMTPKTLVENPDAPAIKGISPHPVSAPPCDGCPPARQSTSSSRETTVSFEMSKSLKRSSEDAAIESSTSSKRRRRSDIDFPRSSSSDLHTSASSASAESKTEAAFDTHSQDTPDTKPKPSSP